jgi:Protein of unknown function (DUF4239)
MIPWLTAQPTPFIASIVFGFTWLTAALIFAIVTVVAKHRGSSDFKAISPVTLTPLSVIAGLLIAFLASHVWTNQERANAYMAREASDLRQAVLLADSLPPDLRTQLRDAINKHIRSVVAEEWPAMAKGEATLERPPLALTGAMGALLSFTPTGPAQHLAQQRALVALEDALDARRNRILLSGATLGHVQWMVISFLAVLILVTIAMIHVDNSRTAAITLFIFASAVAACLFLLVVYDRPYAGGGISVEPRALEHIMPV